MPERHVETAVACTIRPAQAADASAISAVIIQSLRDSNSRDYTPEIIARVERSFAPAAVVELLKQRTVFVAARGARIIGTASLDQAVVRTVFVVPDAQGQGIGRRLMAAVMHEAEIRRVAILTVPSSVTAEAFYARLGFKPVRDAWHGDERTIVMDYRFTS